MTTDSKWQPTQNDNRLKITPNSKWQQTQNYNRLKITSDSKLQHRLIDNCFMSISKIFHSYYGDFTIDNKGLQNLDLFSFNMAFKQREDLIVSWINCCCSYRILSILLQSLVSHFDKLCCTYVRMISPSESITQQWT